MQTQDAPAEFIVKLWPWLEANRNRLIGAAAAILVVAGVVYFISSQREQREVDAGQALTMLLVSPTDNTNIAARANAFADLAVKYAGTDAGRRARLQAGAAFFDAGSYADAQTQFQDFLNASSTGPLAAIAELGLAASLEAQNKLDQAAAAYQRVVSVYPGSDCVQPAEFAMGRIAEAQNKLSVAITHYENVASIGGGSSLVREAAVREAEIKAKMAAAAPKPAAVTAPAVAPKPAAVLTPATNSK